jgi:hypothetical protein
LAKELNNAVKRIDNKIPEVAYAINRYNRQREAYAAKFPNKEYQPNYGIVIAQSDEKYLELQNIRAKNQANIENYNANIEKRKQDLSKANYDGPAGTGSTKSYAKPITNRRHLIKHLMINQLQPLRHPYLRPS